MKLDVFKIKVLMSEKELSQKKLAEKMNAGANTLSVTFAKGKASTVFVGKLAKALGVSVEEIVIDEEAQPCQA